jgi:hypothetical protein
MSTGSKTGAHRATAIYLLGATEYTLPEIRQMIHGWLAGSQRREHPSKETRPWHHVFKQRERKRRSSPRSDSRAPRGIQARANPNGGVSQDVCRCASPDPCRSSRCDAWTAPRWSASAPGSTGPRTLPHSHHTPCFGLLEDL